MPQMAPSPWTKIIVIIPLLVVMAIASFGGQPLSPPPSHSSSTVSTYWQW